MVSAADEAAARTLIERFTAWDQEPALTTDEVDDLLRLAGAEATWAASTPYPMAAAVRDTGVTGRFAVVLAGTSGAVEPDWTADLITDGSVQWAYVGEPSWDVYGAAGVGWDWKAAKVAGRYDLARAGQSWERSQAFAHCTRMAAYYRGLGSGQLAGEGGASGRVGRPGLITVAAPDTTVPVWISPIGSLEPEVTE
jgi:hypothetical protein